MLPLTNHLHPQEFPRLHQIVFGTPNPPTALGPATLAEIDAFVLTLRPIPGQQAQRDVAVQKLDEYFRVT